VLSSSPPKSDIVTSILLIVLPSSNSLLSSLTLSFPSWAIALLELAVFSGSLIHGSKSVINIGLVLYTAD